MKTYLILVLLSVLVIGGCKDTTTNSFDGLTGTLKGRLDFVNSRGQYIYTRGDSMSGVLVQVDGTSFSAITDSNGFWTINNLPTRTYSFTFSKPGFDTMRNTSFSFLGGGTVWMDRQTFVGTPDFEIQLDSATIQYYLSTNSIELISVRGHPKNVSGVRARIVISNSRGLNLSEPSNNSDISDTYHFDNRGFTAAFSTSNFIFSSDTIYITAFPLSQPCNYFDVETGKNVYKGLGKQSNTLMVIRKK